MEAKKEFQKLLNQYVKRYEDLEKDRIVETAEGDWEGVMIIECLQHQCDHMIYELEQTMIKLGLIDEAEGEAA